MGAGTDDLPDWAADKAPWIVVETEAARFACRRCGVRVDFPTPVVLADWVGRSQAFVGDHKGCKGDDMPSAQLVML